MGIWYYPEDEFSNNVGIDMSQITIHSLKTNVSVIKVRLFKTIKCLCTRGDCYEDKIRNSESKGGH
jgi:hypothetical protein